MEIRRIFYAVARKWWLLLLLSVLGGGIGFLNVYYSRPLYQADTTLYIMNLDKVSMKGQSLNTSDITLSQQLVRQYYEIIHSRSVTSVVSQELKVFRIPENQIQSMVSINSRADSNIFTISAKGSDPTIVAAVANSMGRAFASKIRQLSNSDNVGILDEALIPDYPVNNWSTQKVLLGIILGIMVAFGIICIIEYFDTTIRSAEDIEKGLNVNVIGIIPELNIR